jgi:hypothetical protein
MAKPVKKDDNNESMANVISGILLERETVKLRSSVSRVIHSNELSKTTKTQIIGGDSDDIGQDSPPAIIIEKENDQISKIIVKCPCGRHAELVCQYEENS